MSDFLSVGDLLQAVREVYLNDPLTQYTNTKLLPYFKQAYGFLETALEKNNVQCKSAVSAILVVLAGETKFRILPGDFAWPIKLEERLKDSSDNFSPMVQKPWTPSIQRTDKLSYWTWNCEEFQLLGATTDREVQVFYQKKFPTIVDASSFALGKADQFLTAKTAALAHLFIAQNETLANQCNLLAENNLSEIINIFTKLRQSMPSRRKPYIPFR